MIRMKIYRISVLLLVTIGLLYSCAWTKKTFGKASDAVSSVNVFPYTEDITLGKQVSQDIASSPGEFPVLKRQGNDKIYDYIDGLRDKILATNQLKYKDEFAWELTIINDDETLNAFATPGGYIYIYTGLIKFLDSEDELLGVIGHEMAHADRRHSTRQLTKSLGITVLLDAVLGQREAAEQILGALVNLKFSRSHESEADEYSVRYLCNTAYNSDGAAGFFIKLQDQPTPPEFMSTHPNPKNRVEALAGWEKSLKCSGDMTNKSKHAQMKMLLPGS